MTSEPTFVDRACAGVAMGSDSSPAKGRKESKENRPHEALPWPAAPGRAAQGTGSRTSAQFRDRLSDHGALWCCPAASMPQGRTVCTPLPRRRRPLTADPPAD